MYEQKGYVGSSRSVRSQSSVDNFEVPVSMICKSLVKDFISYNCYDADTSSLLLSVPVSLWKFVAERKVTASSWHHTGVFFRETLHYELSDIADYILNNFDSISSEYKEYRREQKPSAEQLALRAEKKAVKKALAEKSLYFKYQSNYKSLNGFMKADIDLAALEVVRKQRIEEKRAQLFNCWKNDPNAKDLLADIDNDELIESYIK